MDLQRVCVPVTEERYFWQFRICDPFAQGPIVTLISQCVVWVIIFFCYHRLKLFFQGRQREERQKELLRNHQYHSKTERDIIEQTLEEMLMSPAAKCNAGGTGSKSPEPVPVSICVDNTCGVELFADLSLRDAASLLRVPDEEVKFLQTSAGPVVQTKMTRLTWPRPKPATTTEAISPQKRLRFLVQLGRWQLILRPRTESKGVKKMQLSVNDTNQVPVVLHSSYSGGILTVEGLHLTQATIQAATKDKCITLKTKYEGGSSGLEVFTTESTLPSKNLAEVFVLASKNIIANGDELRVNSFAIQIQNDSLRTAIRSIIPFALLFIFATKQILASMTRIMETTNAAFLINVWLLLCIFVVSTLILPPRTETMILVTLKQLAMRAYYTIYFAAQCFISEKDTDALSKIEEVSRSPGQLILNHEESGSRFRPRMSTTTPLDDLEYCGDEPKDSDHKPAPNEDDSIANLNWEWPIYDTIYTDEDSDGTLVRREKKTKNTVPVPFLVVYQNLKGLPWASQVVVKIHSTSLIEMIKVLMPDKIDTCIILLNEVKLDRPELFRIYEKLRDEQTFAGEREASEASPTENAEKLLHVSHLLRFLNQEFEHIELMLTSMKSKHALICKHLAKCECKVSWEMLWVLFPPGERVIYKDYLIKENLCGDVLKTCYGKECGNLFFFIEVSKWDYNCATWTNYSRNLKVTMYNGERGILELDIYPMQFTSDPKAAIEKFKKQGKKFCKLSMLERSCFMNYKGSMMSDKDLGRYSRLEKENADGRVMVDLGSFAKMNPDYVRLDSAKPPSDVIRYNKVTKIDIRHVETRMFAPAIVYGFSFRLKKWGCFSVHGFSKIDFNMSSFDGLVMNTDTKGVIENLVRKQLDDGSKIVDQHKYQQFDPITSKGEGTIILCYGPPGTGKTLTAEALSEKLRCPLWRLSVSELGTTPKDLEAMLIKVMDVAASWGALLLMDEADVFLERRSASNLKRNAMTGVFLRQLEYYRGVLFLTTNLDCLFDDAMCSRISLFLHYERHNEDQRRTLWTNMLEQAGLNNTQDHELAEFAKHEFNGREIRNIVKTAHTLSRSKSNEEKLDIDQVKIFLKVYEASTKVWRHNHRVPTPERALDGQRKIRRTLSAESLM